MCQKVFRFRADTINNKSSNHDYYTTIVLIILLFYNADDVGKTWSAMRGPDGGPHGISVCSCHLVRVTNDSHHFISVANREIGAHENLNSEHPENLKE